MQVGLPTWCSCWSITVLSAQISWLVSTWRFVQVAREVLTLLFPAGIYMFKVSNSNTRTRCKICLKLPIKTPEQCQWRRSSVFTVNLEHMSHLVLVFLLLTLSSEMPAGLYTLKSLWWQGGKLETGKWIIKLVQPNMQVQNSHSAKWLILRILWSGSWVPSNASSPFKRTVKRPSMIVVWKYYIVITAEILKKFTLTK